MCHLVLFIAFRSSLVPANMKPFSFIDVNNGDANDKKNKTTQNAETHKTMMVCFPSGMFLMTQLMTLPSPLLNFRLLLTPAKSPNVVLNSDSSLVVSVVPSAVFLTL